MFNRNDHREKRQQVFMSSVEALANILAGVAAFFITPEFYIRTVRWVVEFSTIRYGADIADFVSLGWFACVAAITFFSARMTLATAIVAAGLAAATKFI